MRKDNLIVNKSFSFALLIIDLYKYLTEIKREYVLSKQVLKAGTSIGANVHEAVEAQSKADFISKMSIALKEARETSYWLELLNESNYVAVTPELMKCNQDIVNILTSIIKTAREENKC